MTTGDPDRQWLWLQCEIKDVIKQTRHSSVYIYNFKDFKGAICHLFLAKSLLLIL